MSGNRYRPSRVLLAGRPPRAPPALLSDFAALDFGDELGRALGQLLHGAVEGGTIGGRDHLGEAVHEGERARRELLVDSAAGRREREKRFAQVRAIGAPGEKLALLEMRDRARDLGLVHVSVGADRLAGHHPVLTQGDEYAPLRYPYTVTAVDPRQRLRH